MSDKNFLEMSDEDFLKLRPEDLELNDDNEEEEKNESDETDNDETQSDDNDESTESDKSESEEEESTEEEVEGDSDEESTEDTDDSEDKTPIKNKDVKDKSSGSKDTVESEKKDKETTEEQKVDFKSEYEKLMAPFKANGVDLQIKSVDEAITLMQKGANYNAKMVALKPHLKLIRMLENNGLLDEDKVSHLIDLSKHDKNAIAKLLVDSKTNPMEVDTEDANNYVAGKHSVTDSEMRFNEVLEEIKSTPTYKRTVEIITTGFDQKSKALLAEDPDKISTINSHVQTGLYDEVMTEVTRLQILGKIPSTLSKLEAYDFVGDSLYKAGKLAKYFGEPETQQTNQTESKKPPVKKNVAQETLKDRKKAVAPTKATQKKSSPADFNPLAMSDEEFLKQFG